MPFIHICRLCDKAPQLQFFGSFQRNMQHFLLSHGTTSIEISCVILPEIQPVSDNFT